MRLFMVAYMHNSFYYRRDKWAVYSLADGLETLVERLRDRLRSDPTAPQREEPLEERRHPHQGE